MLPVDYLNVLMDTAYPVDQTGWAFYLRLFLLSRKAIITTIKLPKDMSRASIPMKIEIISYAVMGATSFPMYSGEPFLLSLGGSTPVVSAFLMFILTWEHTFCKDYIFFLFLLS